MNAAISVEKRMPATAVSIFSDVIAENFLKYRNFMSLNNDKNPKFEKVIKPSLRYLPQRTITVSKYKNTLRKLGNKIPNAKAIIPRSFNKPITITKGEVIMERKFITLSLKVCSKDWRNELKIL